MAEALSVTLVGTGDRLGDPTAIAAEQRALEPWRSANLVTVDQQDGPGDLALILVGDPPDPRPEEDVLTPLVVALARSLDSRDDGTVVAGSLEAADSGALGAVRNADDLPSRVSTQDSVDTPWGRIGLVRTARFELTGTAGQYGSGPGSRAPLPTPSPSSPR
jgi:hypothetical protein